MKVTILITSILLTGSHYVLAQDTKIIRVKSGEDARKAIPVTERYRYDEFRSGQVTYTTGKTSDARLNYSLLLDEMHFIDSRGDTLSLANEHVIKQIDIRENVFYYGFEKGYFEVIADYSSVQLARKQVLKPAGSEKMSAYGQSTGVASIRNYNSISNGNGQLHSLVNKGDLLFSKDISYYVVDHNSRIYPANKSTILKIYSRHRRAIGNYVKENRINFSQEEDLKKLLQFCSGLS